LVAAGYRFEPHQPIQAALRQIALECVDMALNELGEARETSVHEARKRLKELRALLRLVRRPLGRGVFARENAALSAAARELAPAREASARVRCFDKLLEHYAGRVTREPFAAVRARLVEERDRALGAADGANLEAAVAGLRDARERMAALVVARQGWAALGRGLRGGYARARRAMHRAYAAPSVEAFHEWRKRAKQHYYHAELFSAFQNAELTDRRKALKSLSDVLGDDHDVAELDVYLAEHETERDPIGVALLRTLAQTRSQELRLSASALGEQLFGEKPAVFARRLRPLLEPELAPAPGVKKAAARSAPRGRAKPA
jgi:hypothetical protein